MVATKYCDPVHQVPRVSPAAGLARGASETPFFPPAAGLARGASEIPTVLWSSVTVSSIVVIASNFDVKFGTAQ